VRVVEAEKMRSVAGVVVKAPQAAGGRALELRPEGSATTRVTSPAAAAVVLRARSNGCGNTKSLTVTVDRGVPHVLVPRSKWREQRVNLTLPAGAHRIDVKFSGRRSARCHLLFDRLRLPAPALRRTADTSPPTAAIGRYVPLGAALQHQYMVKDPAFEAAFRREFVSFTPENEMKMSWIQPEKGQWNFEAADELVRYAGEHGKAVRGHALVFGAATSPWVKRILLADEAEKELRNHIFTVMNRYKHHVREWDVVNEALDIQGKFRYNPWYEKLGGRYVELAFKFAREADPTAKLFYNEFEADTAGIKRDATANLVRTLKDKGLIDGVGLQMHRSLADAPMRDQIEETMHLYESMGLEVQITEMDVLAGGETNVVDRLVIQASAYRRAAEACAAVAACTRFTVWGVTDKYSWMGADQLPLLLDSSFSAKPALSAVREVLGG
jgi:endo-1,4-beta-xylanase